MTETRVALKLSRWSVCLDLSQLVTIGSALVFLYLERRLYQGLEKTSLENILWLFVPRLNCVIVEPRQSGPRDI